MSFRFLLPFAFAFALSSCGGSGVSTVPITHSSTGSTTRAQDVAQNTGTASGTYWSGRVSGISDNGIFANCDQSNFAAGYGCLRIVTTGATVSGTPATGQYFQMWGDLSQLPAITATTINYAASPFPATAPAGVGVTAPLAAGAGFMGFENAVDPPVSFVPYSSASVFRTLISDNPTFASYSSAVVATQFPDGVNTAPIRATEAGINDYSHPRFFASATDPMINVVCTTYCGAPDNGGVPGQIHVPAKARPAGGSDAHFDVVQPDGTEITFWGTSQTSADWTSGATISAASVANCGSYASGQGWLATGPGPTAAGYCDGAGIVTAAELIAGRIDHALFVTGSCANGMQYPGEAGATTHRCTSGVGPPLGAREWYDVPCATTQANGALQPWEKAVLCALNQYGAYLGDNAGGSGSAYFTGGLTPMLESEEPWNDAFGSGYTSPFAALAVQGWTSFAMPGVNHGANGVRWVGADSWRPAGVDFKSHIHWLDSCSARGTC